jgi:alpha-ketoglutarate-dependent taurine dioxygenase
MSVERSLSPKVESSVTQPVPPGDLSGDVRCEPLGPGRLLPLVVRPCSPHIGLAEWISQERATVDARLLEHGAILFRGFDVGSAVDFHRVASSFTPTLFGDYGDLPREPGTAPIYRSTPYPADKPILFHNEASHTHRWPMKQWFFCETAPSQGGETPIVDCRMVYNRLDPQLLDRFAQQGLLYVRNFIPGLDTPWQVFFRSDNPSSVEATCTQAGLEYDWRGLDHLQIRYRCPAIRRHPQTGEMAFFNQVQLHHVSCLEPQIRESLGALYKEQDFPRNVYYGDGSPIEDTAMAAIRRTYHEAAVEFRWERGDILILDNMLTAHARKPYTGPRNILVAMADMTEQSD